MDSAVQLEYERLMAELKVLDEKVDVQRSELEFALLCGWQKDIDDKRMDLSSAQIQRDHKKTLLDRRCNVCCGAVTVSFYMGCKCECVPICAPCKNLVDGSSCHCKARRTFEPALAHYWRTKGVLPEQIQSQSKPLGGLPPLPMRD